MKNILFFFAFILFISFGCQSAKSQQPAPNWTAEQLMEPAQLATILNDNKDLPIIISVGPGAVIPHSIDAGMASEKEGLQNLENAIKDLPKDANIVVYCGCCPYDHCPNVRPAIDALKKGNFSNYHLLDLPHNVNTDWISKGYPTKK